MISYLVQVAIGGIMKYDYPFDSYGEAFRRFRGLSRGTGSEPKDVWLVEYDGDAHEEFELAHKEIIPL